MRFARLTLFTAAAALCGVFTTNSAEAYGWANGYGLGIGGLYRSLDFPTERRVPYFAAHPPVYYSQPVPRTYGYSPFAYGPNVRTPDVVPASSGPVEIVNPYVPSSNKASEGAKKTKRKPKARTVAAPKAEPSGPLMIVNPFVTPTI